MNERSAFMTTMYHGTSIDSARDILRRGFDLKRAGARQKALRGEDVAEVPGIYLTTDKRQARWYAGDDMSSPGLNKGGAVVEVKVTGKLMTDSQWWKLRGAVAKELGDTAMYPDYKTRMATLAEVLKRAARQGYVGFHEHQDEYVIFDPKAIKVTGAFEADTEYKLASHVAARWLTAASVSRRDMEDALDHMSDLAGRTLSLEEFSASPVKNMSMRELYSYDDIDAWAEWEDGELADLSEAELEEELSAFRGRMFARRALRWVKNGTVPPIVVVDSEDAVGIGDGRGRVTVALGMGWDTVPAVVLRDSPRGKTAVRKLFWHGTATKNLRSILSQGLVPRGKLVFDEDVGAAGQRSIKTFGGIYMTDNFMTAWSAATTATHAAAGVRSGPVKSKVMVGITYETRSPNALPDEDDLMPLIERVAGRTYDDLQGHRSMWSPLWPYKSRTSWEGAFNPKYLPQVAEVVEGADLSAGVAKVLENVFEKWEKAERGYKARKPRVDAAIERLLRAHAAHLIENEIVSNRARRIKRVQESLERLPTDSWYAEHPEELPDAVKNYEDELEAIQNPPKLFRNTFPNLAAAAEEVSRLIPEMTGEASGWSMRHNVRSLDPIGYRGKNRIIMVVESQEPKDLYAYKDLIFHVGAQHYKAFIKEYEKSVGQTYRVLDRNGRMLDWSLNPRDEWPEDLWGPAPRAVAASRTARKPPLDEKRRNFNEPTKPDLWEKVLELARGDKRDMKYRGKEIQGPNRGKGFDEYPSSYANGWAVRIYNLLGGKWRRMASENEPTNPGLWEKVQALTKGERDSLTVGDKTVQGPNDGEGFEIFPSAYANGWAAKVYKEFGGGWRKKEASQYRAWTVGELEALPDGAILERKDGSFFVRSSRRIGGWIQGHPDVNAEGGKATPIGYFKQLPDSMLPEVVVSIADVSSDQVNVAVPQWSRSEAEKIGKYIMTPQGTRELEERVRRMGGRGELDLDEWGLGPGASRIFIPLKRDARFASLDEYREILARGKAKKDVGHGGLDEWFSGHDGESGDATWGDWVAITPVKRTVEEDGEKKTYEPGDIIGPCAVSDDPNWKDLTNGGKDPLKCMPRDKAHDMPKSERADKAKDKMKAEKADKNKGQKPTMTPTFKEEKKEATKTRSEKEDEAAEALVRPEPKKKPPRMDLRRHKVDPDDDKDLDDDDKDLSLNYKDIGASLNKVSARIVASRWVEAIAMKAPKDDNKAESIPEEVKEQALKEHQKHKEEHPDSDMTLKDWVKRVMERRKVKPKKPGEKETEEEKKLREEAEAEKAEKSQQKERLQRAENAIDLATLEMLEETSLPYDFRKKMKSSLEGLDDQETLQVVEGFENRLKELASNPPSVEDAVTLATEMREVGGDPDQVGQELAEALYATRVVLNPLNLGGKPISGEKKTSEQLKDRSVEARKHYERLDTEHRASAVRDLIRHRDDLDPESPEHAETVAILRGVGLAAAKNGEEVRGLPSPSSKFTLLAQGLSNHGKEDMLLGSVDDFSAPEAQQAMKDAVQDLTTTELRHLAGDDKVLSPLIDALESGDLPEDRKEMLKHMVATITVGEMAMLDPLVGEALKAKGKPASPKERAEAMKARREERKGRGLPSMLGGPGEALSDPAALLNKLRKGEGLSSPDLDVRGGEKEWITPGGDLDKMTAAIMRDRYEDIASTIGIPEDSKIAPIFEAASEKGWSYVSQGRFEPAPSQPLPLETDDEGKLKKAGYELTPWPSF